MSAQHTKMFIQAEANYVSPGALPTSANNATSMREN